MLDNLLTIPNATFDAGTITVSDPHTTEPVQPSAAGRYANARHDHGQVHLTRDPYGLNKLYFAIDAQHGVRAANYLTFLTTTGTPFDGIYAVPAGCSAIIDHRQRQLTLHRHHQLPPAGSTTDPDPAQHAAPEHLTAWFHRLASTHTGPLALCLSGGLDSALIAALARQHLPGQVTAYTYTYDDGSGISGPDATGAARLATCLGIPYRIVSGCSSDVLRFIPSAL